MIKINKKTILYMNLYKNWEKEMEEFLKLLKIEKMNLVVIIVD